MASRNRGKPRKTIRAISQEAPSAEEHALVLQTLTKGPPIVTAILGQAIIESTLEDLLRWKIPRKDEETWLALTGDNAPFATFNSKIIAGHAFRLYEEALQHNLHVVRKIRNAFAHSKKLIDFEHPLIVKELQSIRLMGSKRSSIYKDLKESKNVFGSGKSSYTILCLTIALQLSKKTEKIYRQQKLLPKKKKQNYKPLR